MGRISKRRSGLVPAVIAVALLAASCSSDSSDDTLETEEADAPATDEEADTANADGENDADSSNAAKPDTLAVQVGEFATLNPFLSSGIGRGTVNAIIYQPLVFLGPESEVLGGAAESWAISDDGLTITFKLREDLAWSDGEPFTSEDALWSMQKYLTADISQWASRIGGVVGQDEGTFEGLRAPDDYTLEVELASPNPAWLTLLAAQGFIIAMLPEHVLGSYSDEELTTTEYFNDAPVTMGPYNFVSWERDQFVELSRNDAWPTPAAFETVQLKLLQSDVASAQLETGDLHLSTLIAPLEADRLQNLDNVTVDTAPGVWPEVLNFTVDDELIADPRIRQAMVYALDLDALCEEVMQGFCEVTWNQVRLLAPEWAIPTDGLIDYEYNPDRARELLAEAGWNEDTKVTLINVGGQDRIRSTEAVVIQAAFADVGIKLDILSTDVGTLLEKAEDETLRPEWQMFINRGAHFAADPSQVSPYASCDTAYPDGANIAWYCNPELDELWAAGLEAVSPEERAPIYHDAFRILNADPDVITLYWPDTIVAQSSDLTGVNPVGQPEHVTWNIAQWDWAG